MVWIAGAYIYPGAGLIAMAIEAARQLNVEKPNRDFRFKDVLIMKALTPPDNETIETQLSMGKQPDQNDPLSTWYDFKFPLQGFHLCSTLLRYDWSWFASPLR